MYKFVMVVIPETDNNIADNQNTSQISTFSSTSQSSAAVDRNFNTRSCTLSWYTNTYAWWSVDLGQSYNVMKIEIYSERNTSLGNSLID